MIGLLQIDYFLEVAEQMSITAAAKKLYVSQPALSKQISLLEQELGVKLFERGTKKIYLTPVGEKLRDELKSAREMLNRALENAVKAGQGHLQPIRIGCFDGRVTDDYLPELIRKIHNYNPKLNTLLSIHDLEEVIRKLREGMIDIAFTLESDYRPEPGYNYARLYRRQSAIVYSDALFDGSKEGKDIKDFRDKPLIIPKQIRGHDLGKHQRKIADELGLNGNNYLEVENINATMFAIELGQGYAILSANITEQNQKIRSITLDSNYDSWILGIVKETNSFANEIFDEVFN